MRPKIAYLSISRNEKKILFDLFYMRHSFSNNLYDNFLSIIITFIYFCQILNLFQVHNSSLLGVETYSS